MRMTTHTLYALLIATTAISMTGCLSIDDFVHKHEVTPPEPTTPERPSGGITDIDPPPEGETQQPSGSQGIEDGKTDEDDPNYTPGGITTVETFDVTRITPSTGSTQGGYTIQIQGRQFDSETTVIFGGTASPLTRNMSRYVLRTLVPAGHKGCVDVIVTNGKQEQKVLEDGFCYTEELSITAVEPSRAVANEVTPVMIYGNGFDETMSFYARCGGEIRKMLDTVIYEDHVEAILPTLPPGTVDILVSTPSAHITQKKAITLLPELTVQDVDPHVLLAGEKATLTVTGSGFDTNPLSMLVGSVKAPASITTNTQLSSTLIMPAAGCYDLVLFDDLRQSHIKKAVYVLDETDDLALVGLFPTSAPIEGGQTTLIGTAFSQEMPVSFGSQPAEIIAQTEHTWDVLVPSVSEPQTVDVSVGDQTLENAFTYYIVPRFSDITPATGKADDTVVIHGKNFDDTLRVFADQYEATQVTVTSDTTATVTMPTSSGRAKITAIQNDNRYDTHLTFNYTETPVLYGASPSQIPVIGGSTIALYGEGYSDAYSLYIADTLVSDVQWESPNYATFIAPEHTLGDYTIELRDADGHTVASTPIKYYEPGGLNTHLSGTRLEGRINVTVLTVNTNKAIANADVFVGTSSSASTLLHETTNAFGQVSFESDKLVGTQILYACAPNHSCNSIQFFNAQDVTIYLEDWDEDSSSSSTITPPPPPPPSDNSTINPIDITVIKPAEDSYITGKVSGFGKVTLESDPNVVRAARVLQSQLGPYNNTSNTDNVLIFEENGTYKLKARRGDVALGLVCGLYNTVTGTFDPRYFGVRTGLYVTNGVTLTADLTCPLPLNQTQSIKMLNIPEGQTSRALSATAYLNLGNYGYIGGFMTGTSQTDLVVITRVPPLRDALAGATLALQTSLTVDNAYRGTIYSYDIEKNNTTVEVGPIVSLPIFDLLPEDNYYTTSTSTVLHNGNGFMKRGRITWHTPRPEYVDFYALTIRGYYSNSTELLWQFYLPGNATSAEFPALDYTRNNEQPRYVYITLTAYKSIFEVYDFNQFSTLDTKAAYVDSSASTTLYIPWESYDTPSTND